MKKISKLLVLFFVCIMVSASYMGTVQAASEPSISIRFIYDHITLPEKADYDFEFRVNRKYDDESYTVAIYKGESITAQNKIWSVKESLKKYKSDDIVIVPVDFQKLGMKAGTYTMEYYTEYVASGKTNKSAVKKVKIDVVTHFHFMPTGVVTKEPTCQAEGVRTYKCTKCDYKKTESIPKVNHEYDNEKITKNPTCKEEGVRTHKCRWCDKYYTSKIAKLPHTYDRGKITKKPTCTAEGVRTYTCTGCGYKVTDNIARAEHTYNSGEVTQKPSCTVDGVFTYTCTACGYQKTKPIPCGHTWDEGIILVNPTVSNPGEKDSVCVVCGVAGRVTIPAIFSDVHNDWYTSYVQYVYDGKLMTGIKGTTKFDPHGNITKAQVAQVIYNMEGQPEISNAEVFTELNDVYSVEWYANAVAWSYDNGIVTGDTNTLKFYPNANVTREQIALMIYRYADYKGYDASERNDLMDLVHQENTSNWARTAVEWAVGAGLISGVDKNGVKDLEPQKNATRAQMAAILQRFSVWVENLPEETPKPEVTEIPEVTETPEITASPEVTETPEITATPEVTEMPVL